MKIKQILSRDSIIATLKASTKEEALKELAGLLISRCPEATPEQLAAVLLEE